LIYNSVIVMSLEQYLNNYKNENILWIVEKYDFTSCRIIDFLLPSFTLDIKQHNRCFNGNTYFTQGFYTLLIGLAFIRMILNMKAKLRYLISFMIITLVFRILYCFYYLFVNIGINDIEPKQITKFNLIFLIYFYLNISQNFCIFTLPNFILGVIAGKLYFIFKKIKETSM